MNRDEFEKIKKAEKERLRMKKRLQALTSSTERQQRAMSLVRKMQQAGASLLRDTQSVVDSLSTEIAKSQARLEIAMDDTDTSEQELAEAEQKASEADRRERARRLVKQFKESVQPTRDANARPDDRPSDASDAEPNAETPEGASAPDDALPDKTIGRMRRPPQDR